ncbi:MAG: GH92 family glycosyl hydrolase [Bacteroidales bacterium]|nr:GH92 family glycosyl hydrolase [Bacteroidales bacterium]
MSMRNITALSIIITIIAGLMISCDSYVQEETAFDPVELVNTLMGTDSEFKLSNGNTYPAIALPWGMNFWTPQTGEMGNGWGYTYDAYKIRGIKQTHQPSPWINDYAAFSLMPVTGRIRFDGEERSSWFSHKTETAKPYYYSVYLADHDVTAEITPTERAAIFRFKFPENDSSFVLVDGFYRGSMVKIIPAERKIIGYCRNNSGGVPDNFHNYFVVEFDRDFDYAHTWLNNELQVDVLEAEGYHAGAIIGFKTKKDEIVNARVASSFISPEQAVINLENEIGTKSFDAVMHEAKEKWNRELGRIRVEDDDYDKIRTFYSCLYRLLLFPRKFYEINADGEKVHYSPYNGEVLPGYMFTDNGFWDTFRAVFPFFTLMYPELNSHIMSGLVNTYMESGWLPEWASPGHRNCMIGSNSASLITDSYLKGIRGYDIETLYKAMIKNTRGNGPVESVGRYGADYYNELGYIPYDVNIRENTARTLEYAYADYCIWKLAQELGRPEEEQELYRNRAYNFVNVFDPGRKLMRGKNLDGSFQSPFSPYKWGDAFTEGNSWHYTWSVFHDIDSLISLMGGNDQFIAKLDSVFEVPPVFDYSYYGIVIHEIREMQIAGMGNYAHGNQPIQHMIYLYNYAGAPWKTQYRVRQVMDKLYNYTPDGYCGDEDNGQTSAWYVFSAMGFYPVCPGSSQYVIGSPLFDKMTIEIPGGNTLEIIAEGNGNKTFYVDDVTFNGATVNKNYFTHNALQKGGKIIFTMSEEPNKKRGTSPESYPYSMSNY